MYLLTGINHSFVNLNEQSKLFCVILNNSYFILKFVMSAQGPDDIDYEEDVTKLKRVWDEIKQPNKKIAKTSDAR